jgi:hypothetical protein
MARLHPESGDVQSMQCTLAFKNGYLDQGISLLNQRLYVGDYRAVERLLFRTGSRPEDLIKRYWILDEIATRPDVLFSHQCYARISQGYLSITLEDKFLAKKTLELLQVLVSELKNDPYVSRCAKPNRHNRTKLLISIYTASYHLAILLDAYSLVKQGWCAVISMVPRLSFNQLNSDAALRMSSNLCRTISSGLFLSGLEAMNGMHRIDEALCLIEQSIQYNCIDMDSRGRLTTHENHLALIAKLRLHLRFLQKYNPADLSVLCKDIAFQLNHSDSQELTLLMQRRLLVLFQLNTAK